MEKLLAIVSLGQRVYGGWLFRRLLLSMIVVVGLTIIIALMVGAALIGSLYAVYFTLHYYGIGQLMAVWTTAMLAILVIAALVFLALTSLRNLRQMPRTLLRQSPITSCAMDTLDAFTDGLMAE